MVKNFVPEYAAFLKKFLNPKKEMKLVFDCSNGTTGLVLKKVFSNHKLLTASYLNDEPDGNFPGHGPNPMLEGATRELQAKVKKHEADMGMIFDSDGDRVFLIDNLGRLVNPDLTARLLIGHLKPKKIVVNVPTGWAVKKIKSEIPDITIFESPVGYYFVMKLMKKTDSEFAAEHSGHYYFKDFFYRDTGILAAIQAINAVSELPYRLSDFVDLLPAYFKIPETNFVIRDGSKLISMMKKIYSHKAQSINEMDGLALEFKDYWFNLRPSNNEPLIRLNIEATSEELLKEKTKELKKIISHLEY